MITTEDYILYGFLAFISLLLVTIVVAMFRQSHDIGELRGQNEGIQRQLTELSARIDVLSERIDRLSERMDELSGRIYNEAGRIDVVLGRIDALTERMEKLEQTVASQAVELGEVKGILLGLNRQMDLLLRHRHDGPTGQVTLIPETIAAD